MNHNDDHRPTRRRFLAGAALAAAAAPLSVAAKTAAPAALPSTLPFWGKHQAGITTPMQRHTYFMAFDLVTEQRADVIALLQAWTEAAALLTSGAAPFDPHLPTDQIPADSGATLGMTPARLSLTFGFGPGLFEKNGVDRFGLAKRRPAALADLPRFTGDQLVAERSGGDLSIQACADDIQIAEHAIRRMVGLLNGRAVIRWAQTGFTPAPKGAETTRNTMGFKDGTMNVPGNNTPAMQQLVWVGAEGADWMRDGSYMVIRPIRIALEHWDKMKLGFQEQTVGRHKMSGAPLGKKHEFDAADFDAEDAEGNPITPETAHVRMATPANNDGAQIFRRAYSYDNGVAYFTERWPPWRQAMTFDAGLLFICYQRDPRTGFSKIFDQMAKFDMLNQFTTHVGSGLFACPPGAQKGEYIGQRLFA